MKQTALRPINMSTAISKCPMAAVMGPQATGAQTTSALEALLS